MNNSALRYLKETGGQAGWGIVGLLAVQTAQSVLGVSYAIYLRNIINAAEDGDGIRFRGAIIELALLFAALLVLSAIRRRLDVETRSRLENRFKARLFGALLNRDYATVNAVHSGEWMNRLTNDTAVAAGGMVDILPGVVGMAVRLIGAVGMIIILEPRFLYLLVPVGAILIVFSTLFRRKMKQLHKTIQEKDGRLRTFLQETLGSLPVVRSFAVEAETLRLAEKRMDEHRRARLKRNHFSNAANTGFSLVMGGATVLGAALCGYGILTGTMDYGSFTAVLSLIGQIKGPFANISGFMPRYYAMIASAERLMEIETVTEDTRPSPMSTEEVLRRYNEDFEGFGLENAEFSYVRRTAGLSEKMEKEEFSPLPGKVSLLVRRGEYVAFTGKSGCGKSTVLKLLMCLYPLDGGERYVVTKGQREPMDGAWQRLFAYVPQGNHLMSGSIREIVAYADRGAIADDARIRDALTIACAEFVFELEQGPDTVLGEYGGGLSEGQMQRIAIARALFSGRPVLMLDESTSALDEATERRLLTNLRSMTDRTVIIITHRRAALDICDAAVRFTESGVEFEKKD